MEAGGLNNQVIPSPPKLQSSPAAARLFPATRISYGSTWQPPRAVSIAVPPTTTTTTPHDQVPVVDDAVAAFWDYQFLFVSQRSETIAPITLSIVDGAIPADFPNGTYYLTGPGLFTDDHGSSVHPLDGHGYLRSFNIDGVKGEVNFMAKYIRTDAVVEERDPTTNTWKFTHRGPFSVLKGGKMVGNTKVMKNVANTSVLRWAGRLFCLWEGGDPYEIQPSTLETIGKFSVAQPQSEVKEIGKDVLSILAASILKPILYGIFKMPPKRLLSHYKIDPKRGRLLIMSCNAEDMLLPRSNFTIYEYDSNFKLVESQEFDIHDHLMIHDWAFTDNHYILFGNRIKLDIPGELGHNFSVIWTTGSMAAVCGLSPMISALSLNPSKPTSPVYLLPRSSSSSEHDKRDWRVPIEAPTQMWLLHVGNAFEEKDENGNSHIQIQASGCSYKWFNFSKMFGYDWKSGKLDPAMMNVDNTMLLPHLVQVSMSLDTTGNCDNCSVEPINQWSKPSDFPIINQEFCGQRNRFVYAATSSGSRRTLPHFPFDTVVKLDCRDQTTASKWSAGNRKFIGEPVFIPKGTDEDDGYILVVEYGVAKQRCYLVILDAKKIGQSNALVARLEVPKYLNFPLGFHGVWAPQL